MEKKRRTLERRRRAERIIKIGSIILLREELREYLDK